MGARPAVRYPMARDITTLPALRSYLCKDGPDGCIGCECPCAYGTKYWRMRETAQQAEIKALRTEVSVLLDKVAEMEAVIRA